jgi:stage II sporulation protein D
MKNARMPHGGKRMKNRTLLSQTWAPVTIAVCSMLAVILLLPSFLVKPDANGSVRESPAERVADLAALSGSVIVPVYLTKEERIEQVPLETYVRNVLAAEMPADFELEALKAQAIAARTYIVKRRLDGDFSQVPVQGALVTDTVAHQAYLSEEQMSKLSATKDAEWQVEKLNRAVAETAGFIMTYNQKPIQAMFFSTSNGYTENSEDYFRDYIPYLRSVPSPWDKEISPKFQTTVRMDVKEFARRLGLGDIQANALSGMKVSGTTAGNRVKSLTVAGKTLTGREVREKLGLASSHFTWKLAGSQIEITSYGYGHGVGMSQWGANGMAKEGKTAEQILLYYYQGVDIVPAEKLLKAG